MTKMVESAIDSLALLKLLQLTSPALPVGAYSYSEGLETLIDRGLINDAPSLGGWLAESLAIGAIAIEVSALIDAHQSWIDRNFDRLNYANDWLSAMRESYELQQQNWQMGRSLLKLLQNLHPEDSDYHSILSRLDSECNFAIAFAIAAGSWRIDSHTAAVGYLHSWAGNLIGAGVKLIPLGQTAGQQLLLNLAPQIIATAEAAFRSPFDRVYACSWGLALASANHETQYSRLFRS
jgi:urease accessory protein